MARSRGAKALLADYDRKRDFSRTSEPPSAARVEGAQGTFVIQKHAARRLHFDFRLELDGVLKSWAVTRGPSLDPTQKRLAVRTEDHPLAYGAFEGTIPKGQYGGGTVQIWDRGHWQPKGNPRAGIAEGMLKFELAGERLKGGFALVRLKPRAKGTRENWLLIKERDEDADAARDPVEVWTTSVATGRSLDAIARNLAPRRRTTKPLAKLQPKAEQAYKLPKFVSPQLATLVEAPPEGPDWGHEIKYDGYRLVAAVAGGEVRLYTRSGLDWTAKFASIKTALSTLDIQSALIDGEAAVADEHGRTDFGRLQRALDANEGDAMTFYAFDLLEHDGTSLRGKPLSERKASLKHLLSPLPNGVVYSEHIRDNGDRMLAEACKLGLEGIVSKRLDSRYTSARTRSWLKVKCLGRDDFVIGGYRVSDKAGRPFASLLVGERVGGELVYRGRVGTGFDELTMTNVAEALRPLARASPPFATVPAEARHGARWVEPKLIAEIAFTERTADGVLRHASFLGLRKDTQVTRKPKTERKRAPNTAPTTRPVNLSSPGKILFAETGITKQSLADYFAAVAPLMLPHVARRPLSLVRCPEGSAKPCFFQKHRTAGFPDAFKTVRIAESDSDVADYLAITDESGLAAAAQIGALELHVWGSKARALERPDRLVFDLDPDERLAFDKVRTAAYDLRDVLGAAGLTSFPLVTGGKGIHVVVPLAAKQGWDVVKGFARGLATRLASDEPERFVATMAKAKRRDRIFIDWMRNERGSTAIAPYSPRARPSAAVACPLSWDELGGCRASDAYSMKEIARRVEAVSDPWANFDDARRSIPKAAFKLVSSS